jgi:hypothetical protein
MRNSLSLGQEVCIYSSVDILIPNLHVVIRNYVEAASVEVKVKVNLGAEENPDDIPRFSP